jgi:hypothetical protein
MKFDDKVLGRKARSKYFENIQNQIIWIKKKYKLIGSGDGE